MKLNEDLRKEWEAAGYRGNMGSVTAMKPPPKEFIRLYHLTTLEYAINNLALGRLKVARISEVNDPFEYMALKLKGGLSGQKALQDLKAIQNEQTGLLCFSGDWTNPVLWSHYGAKHQGVCLGFDVKRDIAQAVHYVGERDLAEVEDISKPRLTREQEDKIRCTKFDNWKYEEEHRVFLTLADMKKEASLYFYEFGKDVRLAEVILGVNCQASIESIRAMVAEKYSTAITFGARLSIKKFSIVPDENRLPPCEK